MQQFAKTPWRDRSPFIRQFIRNFPAHGSSWGHETSNISKDRIHLVFQIEIMMLIIAKQSWQNSFDVLLRVWSN